MSSPPRTAREEERRVNVRTLVIASVASAVAAIATSQVWVRGTPVAAALTPLIVTLVSEMLHRPTERIVGRFTTETDALPEAAGAGPPPREEAREPRPARETAAPPIPEPHRGVPAGAGGVSVYRTPRRRLPLRAIAVTAVLAFAIGAAVLTLPELIAGQSFFKGDRGTTVFGGSHHKRDTTQQQTTETPTTPDQTTQTEPDQTQQQTTPKKPPATTAPQTTPQTAPQTTPAPKLP